MGTVRLEGCAAISSGSVIAIYLYCLVKSARRPSMTHVPGGLPGASRPEAVDASGGLWLVVAEAPLDTYGSGQLEQHLSDMDWVGRIALAHEEVVEVFARRNSATVIPMKLFTMFSTRQRAVADVAGRRRSINAAMRRIAGADEWGVRITRGAPAAAAPLERPRTGAAFLAARKQARDAVHGARVAAAEAAHEAFDRLARLARRARRRDFDDTGGGTPPLLDAVFLVARSHRSRFTLATRRHAAACASAGAVLTVTGPWPAYNFVQDDEHEQ
jgi:hypothetical protein